jgi:hypothetical protein
MDSLRGKVDPFLLRSNPAVLTLPMFDPAHLRFVAPATQPSTPISPARHS